MARPPSATRQFDVLDAIRKHKREFGIAPTHRELMSYTGITSTSVVHYYLRILERDGLVCHIPGIPRSLDLTEDGCGSIATDMSQCLQDLRSSEHPNVRI